MRILFLIYHGFSEVSGISKKIHYQVKGLRENGHDVHLCYYAQGTNGHWCRYIDDVVLKDYGIGKIAAIRHRTYYNCIYNYCIEENIQFVYARCFQNANPWLISFFIKLRKAGVHAVTEIPTFPYDQEIAGAKGIRKLGFLMDKVFRHRLYRYMDGMVTFSDEEKIFGQRTINISNGVDFDSIPLHCSPSIDWGNPSSALHLIAVAEVHTWHGYDRLIEGLGKYYQKNICPRQVFFHLVGGIWSGHLVGDRGIQTLIDKYNLSDKVILHGQLFGDALTAVFNQCQFAIGSLGRHRSGITVIKTLKNREYATRGIPFIYSEQDSDFDHQPYVLKAPADESPVDIQQIVDFMDHFTMKPEEIRKTVEHLTWKIQMQKVIAAVF
jgi:glycosyltransferase involved in cell wall biosynthesis